MQEVTEMPKKEADLDERIQSFNNDVKPLLAKYELGIAAIPRIVEDGRIVADPVLISIRKSPNLENPEA